MFNSITGQFGDTLCIMPIDGRHDGRHWLKISIEYERLFGFITSGRTYRKFLVVQADTLVLMVNNSGFGGSHCVESDRLYLT